MAEVSSETVTFKGEICEEVTYQIDRIEFVVASARWRAYSEPNPLPLKVINAILDQVNSQIIIFLLYL